MKTTAYVLAGWFVVMASLPVSAEEYLWDPFDGHAEGSIAQQRGWTRAPWLNTQTAQVSTARSYSGDRSLELPWHANGSSAVYTNFVSTYVAGVDHPVIRFAARLFVANTNTAFQVGIRNSAAGHLLSAQGGGGYLGYGFQHTGPKWSIYTNRFLDITGYYNRSNNTYRFDYDNAYTVLWGPSDSGTAHGQFNQFVVTRLTNTAQTVGDVFVDNVSVETFPAHVMAWWRCTPQAQNEFVEQLGHFTPAYRESYTDVIRAGASQPVWDGRADYRNEGATRLLCVPPADCVLPTSVASNWTVEAVFQAAPDASNFAFLDWGTDLGFNQTGTRIGWGYVEGQSAIYLNARDREQGDAEYDYRLLGSFRPNGKWQHVAVVKDANVLSLYVDYQWVTNQTLSSFGDGNYAFTTASAASIGRTLNDGNRSGTGVIIDEVRLSSKALALNEFLQPGQPMIVDMDPVPSSGSWSMTMKGILGKFYRVETSLELGDDAHWEADGPAFEVEHTFTFISVPAGDERKSVRVVRE